ncbi:MULTISPECIES: hypothetical protein [Halomonas]|nr:hypothetical protein [Halomonas citrativorans]
MQVAAAVGVPVQGGQVAELTLLRRAIGGEGVALLPLLGCVFTDSALRHATVARDQSLGVVVLERYVTMVVGHAG